MPAEVLGIVRWQEVMMNDGKDLLGILAKCVSRFKCGYLSLRVPTRFICTHFMSNKTSQLV